MITLSFSKEEIAALFELMDAGVRAKGLLAAGNAAVLAQKLQTALNAAKVTPLKAVEGDTPKASAE